MPYRLLFRTDASQAIGTGHAMRCLALAEAIRELGDEATLVTKEMPEGILKRFQEEDVRIQMTHATAGSAEDVKETIAIASAIGASWVIADGYAFGEEYQKGVVDAGLRLLIIDDYGSSKHYHATIVLNQNIGAAPALYEGKISHSALLLLGPSYALLRREFREWKGEPSGTSEMASRILVTFGGGDPPNATAWVLNALKEMPSLSITALVGASNPHGEELESLTRDHMHISLKRDVHNMPTALATSDIVVSAGGSTTYESAFMGVPAITVIIAENQKGLAEGIAKQGATECLGWLQDCKPGVLRKHVQALIEDQKKRDGMVIAGRSLVDGCGAPRLLRAITGDKIFLRTVRMSDAKLLHEWTNDADVRKASFSAKLIPWEEHTAWLHKKLSEDTTRIWIGCDSDDVPTGVIRFEEKNEETILSITVAPSHRGKGFAKELVRLGVLAYLRAFPNAAIHAYVKPENAASAGLFKGMGKEQSPTSDGALHFLLNRHTITS